MKSIVNIKALILLTLGIVFTLPSIIASTHNLEYNDDIMLHNNNVKISKISEKIHIINNSGWEDFRNDGNCTGSGEYSDPYIIQDLIIDGGNTGSCIWIENSNVYFKIINCTIYDSGAGYYPNYDAGIKLTNVNNSHLIDNNCSFNSRGIYLEESYNNIISGNTANNNTEEGIFLYYSTNNTISGNIAKFNERCGITLGRSDKNSVLGNTLTNREYGMYLFYSNNNNLSGNIINNCEYGIYIYDSAHNTISENNANNNIGCGILINTSDNNTISGNSVNNCEYGIYIYYSNNHTLSENTASYNTKNGIYLHYSNNINVSENNVYNNYYGIFLMESDNNTISLNIIKNHQYGMILIYSNYNLIIENELAGNNICYEEFECEGNIFENNNCVNDDEKISVIILISAIGGGTVIGIITVFLIIRLRKTTQ